MLTIRKHTVRELKSICEDNGIDTANVLEKVELEQLALPYLPQPALPPPAAPATSALPPPTAPTPSAAPTRLDVKKAWRDVDGAFDGDTDDSDEEHAADGGIKFSKKRPRGTGERRAFDGGRVWLEPRGGPSISVVATADLHRHHHDRYINGDSQSLAEWFEQSAPDDVDVALFAGDVGLELNSELPATSRGIDRPATGARVSPRENDGLTVDSWARLLGRMLRARPRMHVVLVAGNHDGLLCADEQCLACLHLRRCEGVDRWGKEPATSAAEAERRLIDGLSQSESERFHLLRDGFVDIHLRGRHAAGGGDGGGGGGGGGGGDGGVTVRVVGSPWTSYDTKGREHLSFSHQWRPERGLIFGGKSLSLPQDHLDCEAWWRNHWASVRKMLDVRSGGGSAGGSAGGSDSGGGRGGGCAATPAATILVTHAPPHGVLDIVGGVGGTKSDRYVGRVGDKVLQEMLRGLEWPPILHVFGHVHAVQDRDEPPAGPRLCASKHVPGCVFANVAAERQLPVLTGYRLMKRATEVRQAAAAMQLTEHEWKPDARQLLMRPPMQLVLPLAGYSCDAVGWSDWQ